MKEVFLIGLGGGLGSIFRYLISTWISKYFKGYFPLGTFTVNFLGCLLLGMLLAFFLKSENTHLKLLLTTGFCGGFTTFSTFASENVTLLQNGQTTTAFFYISLSLLAGLLGIWLGYTLLLSYARNY